MVALRRSRRLGLLAPYALATAFFLIGATRVGYQDIGSLMARQTVAAERWRQHVIASPFGTIHAATFSLPRPVGTAVPTPDPIRLARFNADPAAPPVQRAGKGDLLVPRIQIEVANAILRDDAVAAGLDEEEPEDLDAALRYKPFLEYDIAMSLELHPRIPAPAEDTLAGGLPNGDSDASEGDPLFGVGRLFFDGQPMSVALAPIEPWRPDEIPVVMTPPPAENAVAILPLEAPRAAPQDGDDAPERKSDAVREASLGRSPAELLRLTGKARAKAEKCLANAVYFEARSEPVRGQVAVAQVVLNRAFSGYYPNDVCGVVYQGAHRHLSCQFTFACDGIPDVVTEHAHWARAMRIAQATLDGKIWLGDVGKATHYHASYVYPYWVRSMRKHKKIGLHTFYRPRKWGDGAEAPKWGSPVNAEIAANL